MAALFRFLEEDRITFRKALAVVSESLGYNSHLTGM